MIELTKFEPKTLDRNQLDLLPGAGCSANLKARIKKVLTMRLDQITKVPFEATSDRFYVDGSNDK